MAVLAVACVVLLPVVGFESVDALVAPAYTVSVIAGTGSLGSPTPGPATASNLGFLRGVAVDSAGNVYVADKNNEVIEKITPGGTLSVFAGTGLTGIPTPGPATSSRLGNPSAVAIDLGGNLYIADYGNGRIEKIDTAGDLTVFAGDGTFGPAVPGDATLSPLASPRSIAVDATGNVFVASEWQDQVWKITAAGTLSVFAGTGTEGAPVAGPATGSPLTNPTGVAVDAAGNVYIVDGTNQILRVAPDGSLSIFAGIANVYGNPTPGPALASSFSQALGVAVDAAGNVYVADYNFIERITPDGTLAVILGDGNYGPPVPGPASSSPLDGAYGLVVDASGAIFVADSGNRMVVKLTPPPPPPAPLPPATTTTIAPTTTTAAPTPLIVPRKVGLSPALLATSLGLSVPRGAKVSVVIRPRSRTSCYLNRGELLSRKPGSCSIRVAVTLRNGSTVTTSGTFGTE